MSASEEGRSEGGGVRTSELGVALLEVTDLLHELLDRHVLVVRREVPLRAERTRVSIQHAHHTPLAPQATPHRASQTHLRRIPRVAHERVGVRREARDRRKDVPASAKNPHQLPPLLPNLLPPPKNTHPLTKKIFSLLPRSFSNSLLVTFFSAAKTMPIRTGPGYFLSLSALASSSFFFAAAETVGVPAAGVVPAGTSAAGSTAMASETSGAEVKGVAEGPGARMPTTVPAWPGREERKDGR